MDPTVIVIWLVIGAIAGWLASIIVTGRSLGWLWDTVVGLIGGVISGAVGTYIGGEGYFLAVVSAVVGAIILLVIVRLVMTVMPKRA